MVESIFLISAPDFEPLDLNWLLTLIYLPREPKQRTPFHMALPPREHGKTQSHTE